MGISIQVWKFLHDSIRSTGSYEVKMCELGNQIIYGIPEMDKVPSKAYFESIGISHTSIDMNGLDGSLRIDLSVPIEDQSLVGQFDIITNFGTSEHVSNQYCCFRNIHELCRVGGIIVHVVPLYGYWKKHSEYWYTQEFFDAQSTRHQYEMIANMVIEKPNNKTKHQVCVAMRKTSGLPFGHLNGDGFHESEIAGLFFKEGATWNFKKNRQEKI